LPGDHFKRFLTGMLTNHIFMRTTPSRNIFNLSFGHIRLTNDNLIDTSFSTITNEFCFVNKFYHLFHGHFITITGTAFHIRKAAFRFLL